MHGNNDYWLVAPIIQKPHYYPFSCQKGLDLPPVHVATEAGLEDLDPITAPSGTSLLERRCKLQSISSNKEVSRLDQRLNTPAEKPGLAGRPGRPVWRTPRPNVV